MADASTADRIRLVKAHRTHFAWASLKDAVDAVGGGWVPGRVDRDPVSALRRQRDELHETANRYLERARAAEARERVKDEALKPFADYAEHFPFAENDDVIVLVQQLPKVRDFRRAARALAPETPHAE